MKLISLVLPVLVLAASSPAADLSSAVADASKYESGASAEPLRQIEQAVRESAGNAAQRAEVEAGLVKLLATSSSFEARRFACTQLAIIGTDSSFSAIAELLKNPETTGIACLALSSNPSPKANDLLRSALPGATGLPLVQIITVLGDRADSAAVKPLGSLARGADTAVAQAAIAALGKIASPAALTELGSLRRQTEPSQARIAALASLVAADIAAQRGQRVAAVSILDELLSASQPAMVRRAALEGLFRLDQDQGEKRALTVLRGADSNLKPSAIARVRALTSASASKTFARELPTLAPAEQVQMLEALGGRNDDAARAAITAEVSARDASVRRAAVIALASVGDARAVPVLAKALNSSTNVEEQQTMELALASLKGGEKVDQQIAALLQSKVALRRPILINVLARRGNHASIEALLAQCGSPDPATARSAFRALGKLALPADLPALLDQWTGLKVAEARGDAEGAIVKVLSKSTDADQRFAAISPSLARAKDVESRSALLGFLPACGGPQALQAVKSARIESEPQVREAALRALAAWPDASAIDPLLEAAQTATHDSERVIALRGCVYLLDSASEYSAGELAARFQKVAALAKNPNETKLVISGLAKAHDPVALKLLEGYLADPAVQAEAAHAAVSIAPHLCGAYRESTAAALQKVVDLPVDPDLKKSARNLLEVMNRFGDFITGWQVIGPFLQEGKDGQALFDVAFPPEQAGKADLKWQVIPAGQLKDRPWQLDLAQLYGGDNRAAYARAWVYSEAAQPARLELGSDDGIKAWLNGKVVLSANRSGDVAPGTEKAAVTLQPGWNSLMLKVTQWSAGWGFCARVAKPDGTALPGLRIEAFPPK